MNFLGMALDQAGAITAVCLLLLLGRDGPPPKKGRRQSRCTPGSPTPMEGPTPVSALIHRRRPW